MFKFQNGVAINGVAIDEDAVIHAMNDREGDHLYHLDVESGHVEEICTLGLSDHDQDAEKRLRDIRMEKNKRYFKIPSMPEVVRHSWFRTFLADCVRYEDPELAERYLKDSEDDLDIHICEMNLAGGDDGWYEAWNEYLDTGLFSEMKAWLSSLPVKITEEMELFDDCDVCQKMKEAGMHKRFLNDEPTRADQHIRV
mgnify:CR=1 FL=1